MLIGEFHHTLDNKNRVIIPSKFVKELGEEIIITRGFERCLIVYSLDKWNEIITKFSTLAITKTDTRKFMRIFLSGATSCKFDSQKRICIPSILKNYAGINKETVIIGLDDHL